MEKETTQLENGQVNEVKASGMIVTVGGSNRLTTDTGDPLDEYTFPEVPLGADSEYDTWLR